MGVIKRAAKLQLKSNRDDIRRLFTDNLDSPTVCTMSAELGSPRFDPDRK